MTCSMYKHNPITGECITCARPESEHKQVGGDHYAKLDIQPWQAMESWLTHEEFIGYLRGNVIKYMARAGKKDATKQEYQKAHHYLTKLMEVMKC